MSFSVGVEKRLDVGFRKQETLRDNWLGGGLYHRRNHRGSRIGRIVLENTNPVHLGLRKAIVQKRCRGSTSPCFTIDDVSCTGRGGRRQSKMLLPVPTMSQ